MTLLRIAAALAALGLNCLAGTAFAQSQTLVIYPAVGLTSYTVPATTAFEGLRVHTLDGRGPEYSRTANLVVEASCGTFNGQSSVRIDTDLDGYATLPPWVAPATPQTCVLSVKFSSAPATTPAGVVFAMKVTDPVPPRVATQIQYFRTPTTVVKYEPGQFTMGEPVVVLDSAGNKVAAARVRADASCGDFGGWDQPRTAYVTSDANGIAWTPMWHVAPAGTFECTITASLPDNPAAKVTFTMGIIQPQMPATVSILSNNGDELMRGVGGSAYLTNPRDYISATKRADGTILIESRTSETGAPLWTITLGPQLGAQLGLGFYDYADKTPSALHPLLNVERAGFSCTGVVGKFNIKEMAVFGSTITRLAVDIQQSCNGAAAFLLAGVRWNTTLAYYPTSLTPPALPTPAERILSLSSPGSGTITVYLEDQPSCAMNQAFFWPLSNVPAKAPPSLVMPYQPFEYSARNCGAGTTMTFTVEFPDVLPATAQFWTYTGEWRVVDSRVDGRRLHMSIKDGGGDDLDRNVDGRVSVSGVLAIPNGLYQDLWWGGEAENGWGLTLVQHRDVLFANVYVYDENGAPTWYVMPSGAWDSARTTYSGPLYQPVAAPWFAYDAHRYDARASVGQARLTFASPNEATLSYTINGVSDTKKISRVLFGPYDAGKPSRADLWWAGVEENGWGVAIMQQYASLFALWFTYDENGKATWFAMPSFVNTGVNAYSAGIYRTHGPRWLGVPYNRELFGSVKAGDAGFTFDGDTATLHYTLDGRSATKTLTRVPF